MPTKSKIKKPLGKKIIIPANAPVFEDNGNVTVIIGIGKDHYADFVMDSDAWEALKSGQQIHITTIDKT